MNAPVHFSTVPERLRLRVDDFLLLNDSGAFADYGKTELIDGEIYFMNAQWSPHARIKTRLAVQLSQWLQSAGSDLESLVEVSVHASDHDLPEPDITLTRWRGRGAVPVATVALVVEVADTTLDTDLGRKAELYAAAGIPEYWVVDVNAGRVIVQWAPAGAGDRRRHEVAFGETLTSRTIAGLAVDTARLVD